MNKRILYILLWMYAFGLLYFSITSSRSYISDAEKAGNNVFAAAESFGPTASPTPTPSLDHIVINEVSSAGSQDLEWVELYNPTISFVDVSGWIIEDNTSSDTLPPSVPIPSLGYGVIIASNSAVVSIPPEAVTIQLTSTTIGNGLADSGDKLDLKNAEVTVDNMSYGSDSSIFPTPPPAPATNQSLARSPNGADTDTASDWIISSAPSIGASN